MKGEVAWPYGNQGKFCWFGVLSFQPYSVIVWTLFREVAIWQQKSILNAVSARFEPDLARRRLMLHRVKNHAYTVGTRRCGMTKTTAPPMISSWKMYQQVRHHKCHYCRFKNSCMRDFGQGNWRTKKNIWPFPLFPRIVWAHGLQICLY